MWETFRRAVVYVKLGSLIALAFFVAVTIYANQGNRTDVWLLWNFEQVPTLWLIAITALSAIIVYWAATRTRGILRQVAAVREERRRQETASRQEEVARELAAQERRIDEKLRRAVGSPEDSDATDQP